MEKRNDFRNDLKKLNEQQLNEKISDLRDQIYHANNQTYLQRHMNYRRRRMLDYCDSRLEKIKIKK